MSDRMTDIMTIAAFDDFPRLMATGNAISLIAGVRDEVVPNTRPC